ncbi:MAG: phosphoribosylanthranilate isomerase [Planctomycetaceae bacterium]|jgi:phosphoribosylanthranilate isomerase|nr:phosphoribosylanthranilate isomerase [Planctomycetaceae bacterium]MBT4723869.1 phosphoribosylanthranilate isomerase [Planctomycetaceae bacterium]MBT5125015.1 phosphoribosylanthranilate isomerase [Planctomycetaceae bacterium]MBT5599244.1 phosphoribosylanthranilate isomerase [Planctomycetaceae bacterium]MBT5883935.1 phosphoribosylanthranilate isomerase [Planctomycetaceae bacterium]
MTALFKTKICGITSVADAQACCAAGVEAIGLNFYDASPRCITVSQAVEIAAVVGNQIQLVGLFVNHTVDDVRSIHQEVGLQYVQLHGDEDPGYLRQLKDLPLIKAFRCRQKEMPEIVDFLAACTTLDITLQAILLDAFQLGCYGGSGQRLDWETLKSRSHLFGGYDWVLAGGMDADNVAAAITVACPTAVDVASGVESSPGKKDAELVRRFVASAIAAFDSLS